ncbi:MAG: Adenylate cyclase 2 [Syntrophaceae bacterium PtaU1.Bin231]|nr:MAG: Adenylate cyclase 2 [Syntrophaceae bacterium PtaU1.Bin231]HOG18567.1 adenylate/guanylate cyclase domain-containing protein [Syntrophales bacterium]HOI16548.1 adenylate/guanylate cyclase domain-containing protein [Geobacteraceae bacterium]
MIGLVIVDDEEGVRRSLKKVLEKDGYAVHLAEDGARAIQTVRERADDIETVISDFRMPGIDGLETLTEIGRINPEITRIMLTGYATMESAIEAVNAGIDGFLTKPFENAELRVKVRECNVRKRLKQFVSEQIFHELKKAGRHIRPHKRRVTVLFCDIRGFSSMVEQLSTEALSELLNRFYFCPLDNIVFQFNGTLDKHIGDSIMAVFGAPVAQGDDAARAVASGLRMREEMTKMSQQKGSDGREISVGLGIATGEVMAGIFGSPHKKEYTVFGPPVNLAARLEHHAAPNEILICEETQRAVGSLVETERIHPFPVKGIERKIEVYRVLGQRNTP